MENRNTLSVYDLPLKGKRVLIRVDFNVPLDKSGAIADDSRIEASLPTIKYVLEQGGIPILMSHLGRPKGKVVHAFSLAPCAKRLAEMLGKPVVMAKDCVGKEVERQIQHLEPGATLLLENLRFHPGEEKPDEEPAFVGELAKLGDCYINDAFGTAHRAHASTATIVSFFPGRAAPGFLVEKEIKYLGETLLKPKRPFYALIGGAKISTKLGVVKSLASKVDALLIGGAMAYTFLKAQGVQIGESKYEPDCLDQALGILAAFKTGGVRLILPVDHVVARELNPQAPTRVVDNTQGIPPGWVGVDIGPKTLALFKEELKNAATILWNGPMGIFEIEPFAKGTKTLAQAIADTRAITIVGGGDSVAAIRQANLVHKFSHLSTGGGASLEYVEYGTLPGLEALRQACLARG